MRVRVRVRIRVRVRVRMRVRARVRIAMPRQRWQLCMWSCRMRYETRAGVVLQARGVVAWLSCAATLRGCVCLLAFWVSEAPENPRNSRKRSFYLPVCPFPQARSPLLPYLGVSSQLL